MDRNFVKFYRGSLYLRGKEKFNVILPINDPGTPVAPARPCGPGISQKIGK